MLKKIYLYLVFFNAIYVYSSVVLKISSPDGKIFSQLNCVVSGSINYYGIKREQMDYFYIKKTNDNFELSYQEWLCPDSYRQNLEEIDEKIIFEFFDNDKIFETNLDLKATDFLKGCVHDLTTYKRGKGWKKTGKKYVNVTRYIPKTAQEKRKEKLLNYAKNISIASIIILILFGAIGVDFYLQVQTKGA